MTVRSVLLGTLGLLTMGAYGQYVTKYVPGGYELLVRGHLPVSVFGLALFFVMVINPLLAKIHKSLHFRPAEIALILAMILAGCGISGAGFMRQMPKALIHPVLMNRTHPGWQEANLIEETPSALLVNEGRYEDSIMENYVSAMGEPGSPIGINDVPWHAWWRPLLVWGSVFALFALAMISLSVVVHRQWADRERIRYPLVEFVQELFQEGESGKPLIFAKRLFWLGMLAPLFIRIVNGIYLWTDGATVEIPMALDFSGLREGFPQFMRTPGSDALTSLRFYPVAIGFAYFLASDIGFTLGISSFLHVLVMYLLIAFGVNLSGNIMEGGVVQATGFGSWLAAAVMLVYIGRRYYWHTAKQALTFKQQPETGPTEVWAFRSMLLCLVGGAAILRTFGLDWPIAMLAMVGTAMLMLVLTRINAECGVFFMAPGWQVPLVAVGLYGFSNLSPTIIIVLGLTMYILSIDPFESIMPFIANGLKLATGTGLKPGRVGMLLAAGVVVTLAIAIPAAVWADYNHSANIRRGWGSEAIYNTAERNASQLSALGQLDEVRERSAFERIKNMRPERNFLIPMAIGFVLLIGFSVLRLRFPWWPLHPVVILLFGSMMFRRFAFSFLLGWLIKSVITKFGGAQKYIETKNLMIGLIVGELMSGFLFMIITWIYYASTGTTGRVMLLW